MIWSEIHLLRPLWLLALIPLGMLLARLLRRRDGSGDWSAVIDPHLLPSLVVEGDGRPARVPLSLLGAGWLIAVLALAGPSWSRLPQPVYRLKSAAVLVLDLSRSMDVEDLQPSRLARAKYKLLDLLKQRREGQTALVVFAGEPYVVSPLTDDTATIAAMVPALATDLTPVQGSRPDLALRQAGRLLSQAGAPGGEVLLITDGVDNPAATLEAARKLRQDGRRLSILGVGTPQGGPIPSAGGFVTDSHGAIVVPHLDPGPLREITEAGGGIYRTISSGDADLRAAMTVERTGTAQSKSGERTTQRWRDEGPWLALALLPLAAFGFRRGWIAVFALMPAFLPQPAQALGWNDLWLRGDQQGAREMSAGQAAQAADSFRDPAWHAAALYRAGKYQQAADAFGRIEGAEAQYNRGNALAHMGKPREALAAYDQALQLNPKMEDARHNKDLLEKWLEEQQHRQDRDSTQSGKKGGGTGQQGTENDSRGRHQQSGTGNPSSQQGGQSAAQPGKGQSAANHPQRSQGAQPGASAKRSTPDSAVSATSAAGPNAGQGQQSHGVEASAGASGGSPPLPERQGARQKTQRGSAPGSADGHAASSGRPSPGRPQSARADGAEPGGQPTGAVADRPSGPAGAGAATEQARRSESQQALEQWLRRIPDDPGGLLRQKFLQEHLRRQSALGSPGNPW